MCGDTEVITLHTVLIICCALLRRCSHYRRHIAEIGLSCILLKFRHIEGFEMVVVSPNEPHTYLFTYLLTPGSRVLLDKLTGFQLVKKFPDFAEPESSLPHAQVPATCPYREPDQSSPYCPTQLPEDPS